MLCILKFNKHNTIWAVKLIIAVLCFTFLYKKFKTINFYELEELISSNIHKSWYLVAIAFVLFFANWGIEALKWKLLTKKIIKVSFIKSFLAVMGGVAVSSFTPNRTGEFAGRMIFLENKLDSGVIALTVFGSINQLLVTLLAGIPGFIFYLDSAAGFDFNNFSFFTVSMLLTATIIIFLFMFNLNKIICWIKNHFYQNKILAHISNALLLLSFKDIINVFLLSFLRYSVFLFQYIFLLIFFNINLEFWQFFLILPSIFLIQTLIPSFLLSEIGIRLSVAIYILAPLGFGEKNIIGASTSLWVINIVLASAVGVFAILFYKIKNSEL